MLILGFWLMATLEAPVFTGVHLPTWALMGPSGQGDSSGDIGSHSPRARIGPRWLKTLEQFAWYTNNVTAKCPGSLMAKSKIADDSKHSGKFSLPEMAASKHCETLPSLDPRQSIILRLCLSLFNVILHQTADLFGEALASCAMMGQGVLRGLFWPTASAE